MSTETAGRQIMGDTPPEAKAPLSRVDEMSFLDHLEELRWRIIKGMVGVLLGVIVAFTFSKFFIDEILLGPAYSDFFMYTLFGYDAVDLVFQNRTLPGQFFTYWGTLLVVGFIMGAPILIYQMWLFVEPALERGEKSKTRFVAFFISALFLTGVAFGYLILTPFALQFFTQFQISDAVRNDFDINAYFSSLTLWVIACGIIFQLPMVSFGLSKIGLLTPEFLIKHRKVAIVVCFILAAFITPPDPVSQFLVAIPLLVLYQFSIYISRITVRRRNREIWGKNGPPGEK
ncbi:MAG: twin-arginine translocase subunit TatC [Rhodothermaceae bacterium]|nr:twin-arginine translocase subunit TatC [Rhodothermaceae bacterium]